MIALFKKLFATTKISETELKNKDIIDKLNEVTYLENIENIIFSPSSKIYILNVYHDTFDDFLSDMLSNVSNRSIISVNIFAYFNDKENVQYKLKRAITILETNKVNAKIEYEFNELVDSINYLKSLET